jgi:hypothetical protein
VLVVRAEDPSRDATIPRGKQYWKEESEGIFYTRTTGIWQTVWLEPVNRRRVGSLRLTPDVDDASLGRRGLRRGFEPGMALRLVVSFDGEEVLDDRVTVTSPVVRRRLPLIRPGEAPDTPHLSRWPGAKPVEPGEPNLYDLRLELLGADGETLDSVDAYFGVRKVEAREGRVYLNNRPYYQRLVLDQGYFPTASSPPPRTTTSAGTSSSPRRWASTARASTRRSRTRAGCTGPTPWAFSSGARWRTPTSTPKTPSGA